MAIKKEKLFLFDAMAMIYKAYFAMISHPLINKNGQNTSAVYGFVTSLMKILDEEKPDHIAVCFDTAEPTFRHKIFPEYKAQRQEIPTDMPWQILKVKELVKALNVPCIEYGGFEADDIIGTLVRQAEKEDVVSYMVTPDKDYMQLISEKIFMYKPGRTFAGNRSEEIEIVDEKGVEKKFGVTPAQVIEVLGLMGDASDNIPGIKGVGEKTAISLIQEFGSIDNIYNNIDKITKAKLKENLITKKEDAFFARKLVTIITDVPLDINFHNLLKKEADTTKLLPLLEELEFRSLYKRFSSYSINENKAENEKTDDGIEIMIRGEKVEKDTVENSIITHDSIEVNIPESMKIFETIADIKHKYYTIKNNEQYDRLINKLLEEELISFDTETDGLNFLEADLIGLSFSYLENEAIYVPLYGTALTKRSSDDALFGNEKPHLKEMTGVEINYALEKIKPVLESHKIRKVGQNIKFDYLILRNHGIEMQNMYFDSMVASYILDPEGEHKMDRISEKYLAYSPVPIEELIGKGKNQIKMSQVPVEKVSEYAAEDADVTLKLFHRLKYELQKVNLYKLCTEIEFPLVKVLGDMQFEGIMVDRNILNIIDKELVKYIAEFEKKIYELAEEVFKINSTKDLARILFEKLKLATSKKTKTGFSTDISVLEELKYKHEIIPNLIEYRMLTKLKSTYIEGLKNSISPVTGKVHTSLSQITASTGRLSSLNPNLQNIPVRTEAGRNIRKAFIPSREGFFILSADYSQIELRIMAHCADDANMIDAFKRGHDIHTATAMRVFGLNDKKDVTPNMRRKAKEVNFGIIYGVGAFGLASRLDMRNSEAKDIIEKYFSEYPKVKEYMEKTKKFARENGYVQTLKGRRRYLKQINNQNATARAEDERAAINMPIQGTAADMIKIAMINIDEEFRKHKLESKMLLQVHDELVFEVKENEEEAVKRIVKREMKNALELNVPVEVDIGKGNNWFEAH